MKLKKYALRPKIFVEKVLNYIVWCPLSKYVILKSIQKPKVEHYDDIHDGLIGSPRLEPSWWANGWGRTGSRRVTVTQELSTPPRLKATQGVRSRPNSAGIPFETVGVELGRRGGKKQKKSRSRALAKTAVILPNGMARRRENYAEQKHQEWA